jgi:4a-hydroxytetrahydrobiopterin dehydratase
VSTPQGWDEVDGALEREFRFANFSEALDFVNRVGALAEEENHHPDISLGWGRATIRWWTHSAGGITEHDREMASRTSGLGTT